MPDTHKDPSAPSAAALETGRSSSRVGSRAPQMQIKNYTQEQVDQLCRAIVWACGRPGMAEKIAKMAVEESGIGYFEGKLLKVAKKMRYAWFDIMNDKSVGIIEEDKERNLLKIAKPVGVIGALSPSTNPEGTPPFKAMSAIKGRNSIIITPHPRAKVTNKFVCDVMRAALVEFGAPADLIISVDEPSIPKTEELMKQCDRVSPPAARRWSTRPTPAAPRHSASASGKSSTPSTRRPTSKTRQPRSACPRPPIWPRHVRPTIRSCCSARSGDEMLANLQAEGGYLSLAGRRRKTSEALLTDGHINPKIVAQPAENIAEDGRHTAARRQGLLHRAGNRHWS